jgi:hypothetical protein
VGLFDRSAGVAVTVTPAVARPREPVTATITTNKPIDKVTAARLEWGYDNFYRYHWAGHRDRRIRRHIGELHRSVVGTGLLTGDRPVVMSARHRTRWP